MSTAYLNGDWMQLEDARVSPMDRGFLFGDGVYEVIPVHGRIPFFLDRHLSRLGNSLDMTGIPNPMDEAQWRETIERLIASQDYDDQAVYLQVTRGGARRRAHVFPDAAVPTVFMMSRVIDPALADRQMKATTAEDRRWLNCHIKSVALLGSVLAAQQAKEAGCDEAILFRDGLTTECSASNVLAYRNGTLVSPVRDNRILPGITLALTLELAGHLGIAVEERDLPESELRSADEIWITSSTHDIARCIELDGKPFGPDRPGEAFIRICKAFGLLKGMTNPNLEAAASRC